MERLPLKLSIVGALLFAVATYFFGVENAAVGLYCAAMVCITFMVTLILIDAIRAFFWPSKPPIEPTEAFRFILLILVWGSGLESDKKLLWWHPAVWVSVVLVTGAIMIDGMVDTAKGLYRHVMQPKHYRTKF